MTLAIGWSDGKNVLMALDSFASFGEMLHVENDGKRIVTKKVQESYSNGNLTGDTKKMLIVCVGLQLLVNEVQHYWEPPRHKRTKSNEEYMAQVARSLRDLFLEDYTWRLVAEKDGRSIDGYLLIGYNGDIWSVSSDFVISRPTNGFWVVGAAEEMGMGVFTTALECGKTPQEAMAMTMDVCSRYMLEVRPPFNFEAIPEGS